MHMVRHSSARKPLASNFSLNDVNNISVIFNKEGYYRQKQSGCFSTMTLVPKSEISMALSSNIGTLNNNIATITTIVGFSFGYWMSPSLLFKIT